MKEVKDKLSIVLPLKGRGDFTKRWFHYHNAIHCPWKILIGDGDIDSNLPSLIESYLKQGLLDIEYHSSKEFQSTDDQDHLLLFRRLLSLLKAV